MSNESFTNTGETPDRVPSGPGEFVPLPILERIADDHAREVWGTGVARGPALPLVDESGALTVWLFTYARGSSQFPNDTELADRVRAARSHPSGFGHEPSAASSDIGEFGSVYVSANRSRVPVLGVMHSLHPYYLARDEAQEQIEHDLGGAAAPQRLFFLNPHEEYLEFVSGEDVALVDLHTLEQVETKVLEGRPRSEQPPESRRSVEAAWERITAGGLVGLDEESVAAVHTVKRIPQYRNIPIVNQTYWCVPTAFTMTVGFWDNYGTSTVTGYGRLIEYWRDRALNGNGTWRRNIPSLIDEFIDPDAQPKPNWRYPNAVPHVVNTLKKYNFKFGKVGADWTNDWAWDTVKNEIDAGRPLIWTIVGHANCAFGYRISNAGKFVLNYSTWGTTAEAQLREWSHTECRGLEWVHPGGATNGDHAVIAHPDGGEVVMALVPHDLAWFVWGTQIHHTTISDSYDGGASWSVVAQTVTTEEGWNSFAWMPSKPAAKARVRIQCFTTSGDYIAGDGSQQDFEVVETALGVASGKIAFLRVHDLGTGYGPPDDYLDAEMIVRLETTPDLALGLQLRQGSLRADHEAMGSLLREAWRSGSPVGIDYAKTGKKTGTIVRVRRSD